MKPVWIFTVLFVLAFLLVILWADQGTMPYFIAMLYAFPNGDKVGHFLLVGMLAFLVNLSLGCRILKLGRIKILLGSLAIAVLAAVEEFTQSFFALRSASWLDLGASFLGILVLGSLALLFRRKRG